jgi:hypothetical protein
MPSASTLRPGIDEPTGVTLDATHDEDGAMTGNGHPIVLVALNARWSHASLALRCLQANLGDTLRPRSVLLERTIDDRAHDVVEAILLHRPRVVGLSVYIWNATLMLDVARMLRAVAPDVVLVVGGPEVSHEVEDQALCRLAHHVVTGEGEVAFRGICERVLGVARAPLQQLLPWIVAGGTPELSTLSSPYDLYSDDDLTHRTIYVESSRGCPFSCEFCLSSLDEKVRLFDTDTFLKEMQRLIERGCRTFKFIDRTFNLKIDVASRILRFFLDRMDQGLFVHFEMVPDRLPDELRQLLSQFPAGRVQLEVGVQTLEDDTGRRISRRQQVDKLFDNLAFLRASTGVHLHVDLIVGLPGEDLASFGRGFDRLYRALHDDNDDGSGGGGGEIQVGILKRLRGAPIARHTDAWGMVYAEDPPYEVLQTAAIPFFEMQRLKRFARYFDVVDNAGRLPRLLMTSSASPFSSFLAFSDWLWAETRATHGIALPRLATLIAQFLVEAQHVDAAVVHQALQADFGREKLPTQLVAGIPKRQQQRLR